MLGDLWVEIRRIEQAQEIYKKLIKLAEDNSKYKEQILMFEQMGYCEHVQRNYKEAIIWFK